MNTSTNAIFLKEMGITQWSSRETAPMDSAQNQHSESAQEVVQDAAIAPSERIPSGRWWFFGSPVQGDADVLFQGIIRALALSPEEWAWKNPATKIEPQELPQDGSPIVAIALGAAVAQRLSGERDALPQLRETVLAMLDEAAQELPLIATFDLNQLLARPQDKALFWQDLLLARSVLQSN